MVMAMSTPDGIRSHSCCSITVDASATIPPHVGVLELAVSPR